MLMCDIYTVRDETLEKSRHLYKGKDYTFIIRTLMVGPKVPVLHWNLFNVDTNINSLAWSDFIIF